MPAKKERKSKFKKKTTKEASRKSQFPQQNLCLVRCSNSAHNRNGKRSYRFFICVLNLIFGN